MDGLHRNKAILGVSVWSALFLVFVALLFCWKFEQAWISNLNRPGLIVLFCVATVVQFPFFFWGGHHLARAKGYPNTLIFFGILGPPVQLILMSVLLVLPDKLRNHSIRKGNEKTLRTFGS